MAAAPIRANNPSNAIPISSLVNVSSLIEVDFTHFFAGKVSDTNSDFDSVTAQITTYAVVSHSPIYKNAVFAAVTLWKGSINPFVPAVQPMVMA